MRSARTLRHPTELAAAGLVAPERLGELAAVAAQYAIAISPAIAELIDPSDPHDPIARQFVPDRVQRLLDMGVRRLDFQGESVAALEKYGVPRDAIVSHGAVSDLVASAMAEGALAQTDADMAVSITGIAGPGGGTEEKPVGLVHIAVARAGEATLHREYRFGDIGRSAIRLASVAAALEMLQSLV